MPWVKKPTHESHRIYWIFAGIASAMVGSFIAYTPWANRKNNLIPVIERELAESEQNVRALEMRVKVLEAKLGIEDTVGQSSGNAQSLY